MPFRQEYRQSFSAGRIHGQNARTGPDKTNSSAEPAKRRKGCLLGLILFALIWIGAGLALWHAARRAPAPEESETSAPFEIIPQHGDNTSIVEMEEENSKKE